jgi:hypothetical protein
MSACDGITCKIGQASHRETYPERLTSCVPMGCLATPMEFLRPTPSTACVSPEEVVESGEDWAEDQGDNPNSSSTMITRDCVGVMDISLR